MIFTNLIRRFVEKRKEINYLYYRNIFQKEYELLKDYIDIIESSVITYRQENQSLSGRIRILEEQHEIMHNFLVEINKYLVNFSERKGKINDISKNEVKNKKGRK